MRSNPVTKSGHRTTDDNDSLGAISISYISKAKIFFSLSYSVQRVSFCGKVPPVPTFKYRTHHVRLNHIHIPLVWKKFHFGRFSPRTVIFGKWFSRGYYLDQYNNLFKSRFNHYLSYIISHLTSLL